MLEIVKQGEGRLVKGGSDIHTVEQALDCYGLVCGSFTADYASVAGLLLDNFGKCHYFLER